MPHRKHRSLIVGSGLSALGAAIALESSGVAFDVVDVGQLPPGSSRQIEPERPVPLRRKAISKTVGGSDYFLSKRFWASSHRAKKDLLVPSSEAFGGMAAGWGAAALPLCRQRVESWGRLGISLEHSFKEVMARIPYSFEHDDLTRLYHSYEVEPDNFGVRSGADSLVLRLTAGATKLDAVVGRARLMLRTGLGGCSGLGVCMSGCPQNAIFHPGSDLQRLVKRAGGSLRSGARVCRLIQDENALRVEVSEGEKREILGPFATVFLAAGPIPDLEILNRSRPSIPKAIVEARSGFVFAALDSRAVPKRKFKVTLATAFIELFSRRAGSDVHTQVSETNELLTERILRTFSPWLPMALLRSLSSRLRLFFVNFTGPRAARYEVEASKSSPNGLAIRCERPRFSPLVVRDSLRVLGKLALRAGLLPIPLVYQPPSSYHLGAVKRENGEPFFGLDGTYPLFPQLRVVDTSVFPELPPSTLGLTAMANAHRIAAETVNCLKEGT